jgi:hypothetical protein
MGNLFQKPDGLIESPFQRRTDHTSQAKISVNPIFVPAPFRVLPRSGEHRIRGARDELGLGALADTDGVPTEKPCRGDERKDSPTTLYF